MIVILNGKLIFILMAALNEQKLKSHFIINLQAYIAH